MHDATLIVDTAIISENIRVLKEQVAGRSKFMWVVKANAYGLGISLIRKVKQTLIDYYGVARAEEAKELSLFVKQNILIFKNTEIADLEFLQGEQFEFTISDVTSLTLIDRYLKREKRSIVIHLNANTGMNRLGIPSGDIEEVIRILKQNPYIRLKGLYTHFSSADEEDRSITEKQIRLFNVLRERFKKDFPKIMFHAANSAATLNFPQSHYDLVRCGLASYGILPAGSERFQNQIKESFVLKSKIIQILNIKKGDAVGYGGRYTAEKDTTIASVSIGYGDGVKRLLSNKGKLLIGSELFPIVGIISMDQLSIEISDSKRNISDEVFIINSDASDEISAKSLAEQCQTIAYEIITSITDRVKRVYL